MRVRHLLSAAVGFRAILSGAGPTFGVPLAFDVERTTDGAPGPSARLSVSHARSGVVRNDRGPAARFSWTTVRLDACPLAVGRPFLLLHACAGLEGGVLRGTPEDVESPRARSRPWWAAHVLARLQWRWSRRIGLELESGVALPFVREEFVVDPDYALYRPPIVLFGAQAALTVHFL